MKPCPFCGRTDLLGVEPRPVTGYAAVHCRACGAIGTGGRSSMDDEARKKAQGVESEAVAHWNRRADDDIRAALAEALTDWESWLRESRGRGEMPENTKERSTLERIAELRAKYIGGTPGWPYRCVKPGCARLFEANPGACPYCGSDIRLEGRQ